MVVDGLKRLLTHGFLLSIVLAFASLSVGRLRGRIRPCKAVVVVVRYVYNKQPEPETRKRCNRGVKLARENRALSTLNEANNEKGSCLLVAVGATSAVSLSGSKKHPRQTSQPQPLLGARQ